MLTVASLLAAMTIAGAFWVGVLAARRLRDWGEGRRALENGGNPPLALAAASPSGPPDDARSQRIREVVAQRLHKSRLRSLESAAHTGARDADVEITTLRAGDVVVVEDGDPSTDGDFIVEGLVLLREGGATTVAANLADGNRRRWLIAPVDAPEWMLVEPVPAHGLEGEPPRNIRRPLGDFALYRRGQASAACTGRHERPEAPRVATYVYTSSGRDVLWLERWGQQVVLAEGRSVDRHNISFLPGS